MGLYPSDKKKLLALPFYLAKRAENPERFGDDEEALFKELTGLNWQDDKSIEISRTHDLEEKITEFEYEKYLNPTLIKDLDTSSDEFKQMVRTANFASKTRLEQIEHKKKEFSKLGNVLTSLNPTEKRALIHMIKNS